jgi:hypothetical protein
MFFAVLLIRIPEHFGLVGYDPSSETGSDICATAACKIF